MGEVDFELTIVFSRPHIVDQTGSLVKRFLVSCISG